MFALVEVFWNLPQRWHLVGLDIVATIDVFVVEHGQHRRDRQGIEVATRDERKRFVFSSSLVFSHILGCHLNVVYCLSELYVVVERTMFEVSVTEYDGLMGRPVLEVDEHCLLLLLVRDLVWHPLADVC
jgi:hypothetical protein